MNASIDPSTLRKGSCVRFNGERGVYRLEGYEEKRAGCMWLIARGPLGPYEISGRAFYVGPKRTTRVDVVSGKRERLTPLRVRLVKGG